MWTRGIGGRFTAGHYYQPGEDLTNHEGCAVVLKEDKKIYLSTIVKDKTVIGFLGKRLTAYDSITNTKYENIGFVVGIGDSYQWEKTSTDNSKNTIIETKTINGIKVCNQNGNIKIGDFLTTSSKKGCFMKQDDDLVHNYTAARCMEDIVFDASGIKDNVYCIMMCG